MPRTRDVQLIGSEEFQFPKIGWLFRFLALSISLSLVAIPFSKISNQSCANRTHVNSPKHMYSNKYGIKVVVKDSGDGSGDIATAQLCFSIPISASLQCLPPSLCPSHCQKCRQRYLSNGHCWNNRKLRDETMWNELHTPKYPSETIGYLASVCVAKKGRRKRKGSKRNLKTGQTMLF